MDFKRIELDLNETNLALFSRGDVLTLPEIEDYEFVASDVLVVKIQKRTKSDALGVPKDSGKSDPLNKKISVDQICELEFVVVFARKNVIYYTGSQNEVRKVINSFFNVNNVNFITNINIENLAQLNKIVLTDNTPNQMNMNSYSSDSMRLIAELADYTNIKKLKSEFTVRIKTGSLFRQKLRDFLNKKPANVNYDFYGVDKKGHKIFVSTNKSILKISLFGSNLMHEERQKITAQQIYTSILNTVGGEDGI